MRIITPECKLVGLLGNPLGQSISARAHNAVYENKGWDLYYVPMEVKERNSLEAVVRGIQALNFVGFAITKPYKVDVMEFLDDADEMTKTMGACNTVVIQPDRTLKGYNTDGLGAIRALQEEAGLDCAGKRFFCFGAGGVGRAICLELAFHHAGHIYISDFEKPSQQLAEHLNSLFPGICTPVSLNDLHGVADGVEGADVLMNLSGLGMQPHLDETPMDKKLFRPGQVCFDAVYNPARTRFLQEAEEAGCKAINGLGMLVYQATRQITLWAGYDEPIAEMTLEMRAAIEEA